MILFEFDLLELDAKNKIFLEQNNLIESAKIKRKTLLEYIFCF